jgi:sporulation protein YlmC with PRC-barrel domain
MLKSLSLSVPILALAGGLAFAQMQTDRQPANSEHSMSSLASNHWLASDIYKASVYDPSNNKIGSIEDLVLDTSGQVQTAVIGVGGFLGIGQKDVAVPFGELKVASRSGREELVLNRTKEQLKDAPAYDKAAKAD